jgi:urease accessory protein UreH
MRVPLADVGRHGRMELTFASQNGRTILQNAYCEVPFKVTRLLHEHAPIASLILMHSTAGLFGGDELNCSIRVKQGARVRITQQSATKIHPSEDRIARQRTEIFVEPGAELQLHLEPIIPFADSRLQQETRLNIEAGGRLSYWEGFMTGRVGRGESWQFGQLASETTLHYGGHLIYLDRFRLAPNGPHHFTWTMGNADYTGIGLHVGEDARARASELHQVLPGAGIDALSDNVTLARIVSPSGPHFHHCREMFCANSPPGSGGVAARSADGAVD